MSHADRSHDRQAAHGVQPHDDETAVHTVVSKVARSVRARLDAS